MHGTVAPPMMSSPRKTPKGSPPTSARATRMAWPRPAAGKTALRTLMRELLSGGAEGWPVLAVERDLDPAPQLGLGGQASIGRHPHGEADDDVAAAESHDTHNLGTVQRSPRLPRP